MTDPCVFFVFCYIFYNSNFDAIFAVSATLAANDRSEPPCVLDELGPLICQLAPSILSIAVFDMRQRARTPANTRFLLASVLTFPAPFLPCHVQLRQHQYDFRCNRRPKSKWTL
jgi:hypothetical protein